MRLFSVSKKCHLRLRATKPRESAAFGLPCEQKAVSSASANKPSQAAKNIQRPKIVRV
jgi:hypothetical protein